MTERQRHAIVLVYEAMMRELSSIFARHKALLASLSTAQPAPTAKTNGVRMASACHVVVRGRRTPAVLITSVPALSAGLRGARRSVRAGAPQPLLLQGVAGLSFADRCILSWGCRLLVIWQNICGSAHERTASVTTMKLRCRR